MVEVNTGGSPNREAREQANLGKAPLEEELGPRRNVFSPLSRQLIFDGIQLHAVQFGNGEGGEVLLYHGTAQSAFSFQESALFLGQRYRTFAVDLRGHGKSDRPGDGDYSREAFVSDIAGASSILLSGPGNLVGASVSGMYVIDFAAAYPDRVNSIILVDILPSINMKFADPLLQHLRDFRAESFDAAVDALHRLNPQRSKENIQENIQHTVGKLDDGYYGYLMDPRFVDTLLESEFEKRWQALARVTCPVLLIQGRKSPLLSEDSVSRFLRDTNSPKHVIIKSAGHAVAGDAPREFASAVDQFLSK